MEYHVYWFLKSSCFEIFRDGKYGLFWAKKLMEKWYLLINEKFLFWTFPRWEIRSLCDPKSWWKIIFPNYSKVLVLNFSEMRNMVVLWAKELIERWYLLITEKFMFWTFPRWEIRSLSDPKSWWKIIFTNYWEVLVLNFSVMGNTVIFRPKNWWKDNIYLVFFSFPSYFRIWEIWFFVQYHK